MNDFDKAARYAGLDELFPGFLYNDSFVFETLRGDLVMDGTPIHQCQCPACRTGEEHPERKHHHQLNVLLPRLNEQQRRWVAALESQKIGHGGDTRVALITGLHVDTIRRGRQELEAELAERPTDRIRNPGAGRPPVKKKTRRSSTP
jgi:hypothetical protein